MGFNLTVDFDGPAVALSRRLTNHLIPAPVGPSWQSRGADPDEGIGVRADKFERFSHAGYWRPADFDRSAKTHGGQEAENAEQKAARLEGDHLAVRLVN